MGTGFSSTRLSLINRNIIWVTAHIRGGMEKGMKWWKEGKMLKKKNTFNDYISVARYLIKNKYTSKNKIIGMGGSAGGSSKLKRIFPDVSLILEDIVFLSAIRLINIV